MQQEASPTDICGVMPIISIRKPKKIEPMMIVSKYIQVNLLPKDFFTTSIEARLTAGPAISITNAAAGERPLSINAAATGMLPVEQIYIGTAISKMISICNIGCEPKCKKNSSGMAIFINAASKSPTIKRKPMFCIISK